MLDASRFLAQSSSRLSLGRPDHTEKSRNPLDRRQTPYGSRYIQRSSFHNPYQQSGSYLSRFPFGGRKNRDVQAPLFSGDHFEPELDYEEQHERDMADYLALRESRRNFGPSHLTDSSELDDERQGAVESIHLKPPERRGFVGADIHGGRVNQRLVDVNLDSTIRESAENFDPLASDIDDRPTPFLGFGQPRQEKQGYGETQSRGNDDEEAHYRTPLPASPDQELSSQRQTVVLSSPHHDVFWAQLYKIALFSMFATFILIWLHTSTPSNKKPLGDSIYSALTGSLYLLLWDTLIAIIVAMVWLALLREHVRTLVLLMLVAVPVILFSFAIFPFVSSFKGTWHGNSVQDKVMRWMSSIPAVLACIWVYSIYKGRHSLGKAISILEFSCKIVASSPALILLGFATLFVVVFSTWLWLGMFTRIFLSGHFNKIKTFILDISSWWLGSFFILVYLWSLGVISGIQRSTTAATVSQWYFHRMTTPTPSSKDVVAASLSHATGPMLGSICLSSFLSLLIRLPLVVLPRRISSIITLLAYSVVPTSLTTLTNPLTLTYAAIHSQPLSISARGIGQLNFLSRDTPSESIHPSAFSPMSSSSSNLIPYRLAKLLLHATRFVMSFALGFAGWITTAHSLQLRTSVDNTGKTIRGSLYGYLVGLIAASIGWAVLGAIEGVIGGVVDAAIVCWASETGGRGGVNEARYCREAGELFGIQDEDDREDF